jgi:hypothetical protein
MSSYKKNDNDLSKIHKPVNYTEASFHLNRTMIRCSSCDWQTEEEMDLFTDPIPTCQVCGSAELEYPRDVDCGERCCLSCERFREIVLGLIFIIGENESPPRGCRGGVDR